MFKNLAMFLAVLALLVVPAALTHAQAQPSQTSGLSASAIADLFSQIAGNLTTGVSTPVSSGGGAGNFSNVSQGNAQTNLTSFNTNLNVSGLSVAGDIAVLPQGSIGSGKAYGCPGCNHSNEIQLYDGTGQMSFSVGGGANPKYIFYGGRVGVGVANPEAALDVNGDIRAGGDGGTIYAKRLCVGENSMDPANCSNDANPRGTWCGVSFGSAGGQMDCKGKSIGVAPLLSCPTGYTGMTIGIGTSMGYFGTCVKN